MNKIKLVVTIIGGGMFLFLLYSFIVNHYFKLGYPYNTFLFSEVDNFMDFYNVNNFVEDFNPYSSDKTVSYPPFALVFAYPFSLFFNYSKHGPYLARESLLAIFSYLILFVSFSCFLLKYTYHSIKGNGKLNDYIYTTILFFTYPVFFLFDRGNYLMISFVFVCLFAYYYVLNPTKSLYFLSAAIAMKIYPVMFILLFLVERKYKNIWKVAAITACLSIIPMLLFRGDFVSNVVSFIKNLFFFSGGYVNELSNVSWNLSLLGAIKILIMLFNNGILLLDVKLPFLILAVLLIAIVVFLLKKEVRLDRKMTYLVSLQILIMPLSFDYSLIYLYVPLLMLLKNRRDLDVEDCFSIIVIALLFIPKSYGILYHDSVMAVSIQSLINPILLLLLIIYPFYKRVMEGSSLKTIE